MKDFLKLFAGGLLAIFIAACSQQAQDDVAAAAPTETAEEFVARVDEDFRGYWRELNAAGWLRATYINEDSAIVDALANERYAAWHAARVKEAMQYDGVEMIRGSIHHTVCSLGQRRCRVTQTRHIV